MGCRCSYVRFLKRQEQQKSEQEKREVNIMSSKEILEQALKLKPDERFMVVEGIINSLDEPDSSIDAIWAGEAEKRLRAYRAGELEGIPMED